MKTTLNKIRALSPCASGWEKLLKNLGKTKADDEPLALTTVLESNGPDDVLWCLRAVVGYEREMRLYAIDCARSVQHLMADQRSLAALDVAELFANGLATQTELATAWDAARATARDAARTAAWDAAGTSAGTAAWTAARDAARATARDAARTAAWDAAWDAARDAQANLFIFMCEGCYES